MSEHQARRAIRDAHAAGRLGHLLREAVGEWGLVQLVGKLEPWQVCELAGHRERIKLVVEIRGEGYEGLGEWKCDVCGWGVSRVRPRS